MAMLLWLIPWLCNRRISRYWVIFMTSHNEFVPFSGTFFHFTGGLLWWLNRPVMVAQFLASYWLNSRVRMALAERIIQNVRPMAVS